MRKESISIPYGKRSIRISLPSSRILGVLEEKVSKLQDINGLIARSLDKSRLMSAVKNKKSVLIVVPDDTRKAHAKEVLRHLIKRIDDGSRSISIIIATGLHKKLSADKLRLHLGADIVARYSVINHDQGEKSLVNLGWTSENIPIILNKHVLSHDIIITIGLIEPHLYAGFSGGFKTLGIGLAGEETINATHSVRFLDDPMTKLGSVSRNPFQNALREIAARVRIGFTINIVNDPDGTAVRIFSGNVTTVFRQGVKYAKELFEYGVKSRSDVVICGIGYPKDVNLYQASRAINYIVNVDRPIIRKWGALIIAAELPDGIGDGLSEKRFYERLALLTSPAVFVSDVKREGCIAGEHRAYMVAKPLLCYNIVFVSKERRDYMNNLPFPFFSNMDAALRHVDKTIGKDSKIYIVPRALSTIPKLTKRG